MSRRGTETTARTFAVSLQLGFASDPKSLRCLRVTASVRSAWGVGAEGADASRTRAALAFSESAASVLEVKSAIRCHCVSAADPQAAAASASLPVPPEQCLVVVPALSSHDERACFVVCQASSSPLISLS